MAFSTIFVTFDSDHDAECILKEHKLFGTSISGMFPRYAVEVPLGKEQEIANLLGETEGVRKVSESCIYGKERKKRESRNKASDSDPKGSKN
jgi:hypothetical protein